MIRGGSGVGRGRKRGVGERDEWGYGEGKVEVGRKQEMGRGEKTGERKWEWGEKSGVGRGHTQRKGSHSSVDDTSLPSASQIRPIGFQGILM